MRPCGGSVRIETAVGASVEIALGLRPIYRLPRIGRNGGVVRERFAVRRRRFSVHTPEKRGELLAGDGFQRMKAAVGIPGGNSFQRRPIQYSLQNRTIQPFGVESGLMIPTFVKNRNVRKIMMIRDSRLMGQSVIQRVHDARTADGKIRVKIQIRIRVHNIVPVAIFRGGGVPVVAIDIGKQRGLLTGESRNREDGAERGNDRQANQYFA